MKKLIRILQIVFIPYYVIWKQGRKIKIMSEFNHMNTAFLSGLWCIERHPSKVSYEWILSHVFKPEIPSNEHIDKYIKKYGYRKRKA